jgi:hypothetical protein
LVVVVVVVVDNDGGDIPESKTKEDIVPLAENVSNLSAVMTL